MTVPSPWVATNRGSSARRRLAAGPVLLLAALLGLFLPALVSGPASAASGGKIYVIHGIVGQTLDIFVDAKEVMPAAKPKTIVGPLTLDAGTHEVSLKSSGKVVASARFTLGAGQTLDVVAHLRSDASMGATVTAFRDDLSAVAPGKLRLAVAHVAAAPPANIKVNGDVLFSNVASGQTLTVVVPAATYTVEIVPAATAGKSILGPVDLTLKAATLTRVYAVGNVTTGTMDAIVHTLPVSVTGSAAPRSVPTGNGGQAATEFVSHRPGAADLLVGSGLGLLGVAGALGMARRRIRSRSAL